MNNYNYNITVTIGNRGPEFNFNSLEEAAHFAEIAIKSLDPDDEVGCNKVWIEAMLTIKEDKDHENR